ncbi:protein containing RDD domain [sediment metagenome]|uniref:Protein containing RDD domain n=1 Tax=sediment metagenome TaxID=749907 RepID=D9PKW6_9ZZZZ
MTELTKQDNASTSNFQYAGFGLRFLAYWVDFLLLYILGFILQIATGNNPFAVFTAQSLSDLQKIQSSSNSFIIIALLAGIVYYLIFWVNHDGATPGKKLLGIKIIRNNGEKLSYPVAFVRYVGYILSAFTVFFFFIGYLWIIWDKKKQALHDKIAGTVVVRTDKKPNIALAVILVFIAISTYFVFMGTAMLHGFRLGMKEARSQRNIRNEKQIFTQVQADELAANVFIKINEKRIQNNLEVYKEDQRICAYAQRRLEQLNTLGKNDDYKGFMKISLILK